MRLCDSIDTLAMAYLDDELAGEERHELDMHLTECASCKAELEAARADQELLHMSLQAPRASDTMRIRLAKALDQAEREDVKRDRRRWARYVLPGGAILAAAAAILVFVGVGFKPPGERVASMTRSALHTTMRPAVRDLPMDVEGPRTSGWVQQFSGDAPLMLPSDASTVIGARSLPQGINGHDAMLIAYQVTVKGRRVTLVELAINNVRPEEMLDGDEVESGGRTMRVLRQDGKTAVTTVDGNHIGYMFQADELSADDLIALVGKTGLVGPRD